MRPRPRPESVHEVENEAEAEASPYTMQKMEKKTMKILCRTVLVKFDGQPVHIHVTLACH